MPCLHHGLCSIWTVINLKVNSCNALYPRLKCSWQWTRRHIAVTFLLSTAAVPWHLVGL